MLRQFFLTLALVAVPISASAKDWTGHWVARSGDTPLFSFDIDEKGQAPSVNWTRPTHMSLTQTGVRDVRGPVIRLSAVKVVETVDGLSMTFMKPGENDETRFILREADFMHATAELADLPAGFAFEPIPISLENEEPSYKEWKPSAAYRFTAYYADNPEMKAIFEDDQAARSADKIDWAKVGPEDAARLQRTRELLNTNALNSGADFYYASFIFQHGAAPGDYLLAHLLAMAAMARGYDASWIAAATLDRYLQKIGQAQVFGTQYSKPSDGQWTQSPYDSGLIPDSLRKVVGVPDRKSQDDKLKTMQ